MNDDTISAQAWVADTPAAAWSACEPPELIAPPRWSHAWARVAASAVAVGSAAGAVLLLLNPPATAAVVMAAPPPAAVVVDPESLKNADPGPFVMPTATAVQETADGVYLTGLRRAHISFPVGTDPAALISDGHLACRDLATYGYTPSQLASVIAPQFKHLTLDQINSFVLSAVAAYCPEYGGGQ